MKKTILTILFLSCSLNSFSQEKDLPCAKSILQKEFEDIANDFQIPNCYLTDYVQAKTTNFNKLCRECLPKFKQGMDKFKGMAVDYRQVDLKAALTNELKRSLSASLLDIVNLRSVYSTNADFTNATSACNIDAFEARIKKQNCAKDISIKDLKTEMAEELANLLSKTPQKNSRGLLDRKMEPACNISDISIIRAKSLNLEVALTPEVVSKIASFGALDKASLEMELASLNPDFDFSGALKSHPVFNHLLDDPTKFIDFFKKLPKPSTQESLRASIYTNKTANGALADDISNRCRRAFETFEKSICNDALQSGKIKLRNVSDATRFMNLPQLEDEEIINPESKEQLHANYGLSNLCQVRSENADAFDFMAVSKTMTDWMGERYTQNTYQEYKATRYDDEIGSSRTALCNIKNGKMKCVKGTYQCDLYQILEKENDTTTEVGRLAKSSDAKVNALLRSFIGTTEGMSASTRSTLINEGILPKNAQGEYMEQPEVPERQADYIRNMADTAKVDPAAKSTASALAPRPARSPASATETTSSSQSYTYTPSTPVIAPKAQPSSPESYQADPEMRDIDDEILRRLSQKKAGSETPATKAEATQAVTDHYKSKGFPITPGQASTIADRAMGAYNGTATTNTPAMAEADKAALDPGPNAKEEWAKTQKLNALSGMAGAQALAGRTPASVGTGEGQGEAKDKTLSTVAVNIADDKVKMELTSILNEKLMKNDSEGLRLREFLQSKKDFILQVNRTSFKVSFDKGAGQFKITLAGGDSEEGRLLRPQLEKFFNKTTPRK